MGNMAPPPQVKEEKMVRFSEPPTSPGNREEEGMDILQEYLPSPPQEPEVKVNEGGQYSSEEEDVKETRRTSWAK